VRLGVQGGKPPPIVATVGGGGLFGDGGGKKCRVRGGKTIGVAKRALDGATGDLRGSRAWVIIGLSGNPSLEELGCLQSRDCRRVSLDLRGRTGLHARGLRARSVGWRGGIWGTSRRVLFSAARDGRRSLILVRRLFRHRGPRHVCVTMWGLPGILLLVAAEASSSSRRAVRGRPLGV
jgi:hypothetical protein